MTRLLLDEGHAFKRLLSPPPPGKSALHWAAAVNNVDATIALLKNNANKDMQDLKVTQRVQTSSKRVRNQAELYSDSVGSDK